MRKILIYATKNQNHPGVRLLHRSDASLPGLHRNDPRMAGMDGKGTVPACRPRPQFRNCGSTSHPHASFRTSLLFGNMPYGSDAGHHLMDSRKDKEEEQVPLLILACKELAQIYGSGGIRRCPDCWRPFSGCPRRTIQRIRTHRRQPPCPCLPARKQLLRMDSGKSRKLCLLQY